MGGGVYKLAGYLQSNGTANFDAAGYRPLWADQSSKGIGHPYGPRAVVLRCPDGQRLRVAAGQLQSPGHSRPAPHRRLAAHDGRDRAVAPGSNGTWTWRRLAHHRTHYLGFDTGPRGNVDPTGSFVLFQSNWDGSPRTDVFLVMVPPLSGESTSTSTPPPAPADSTALSVSITSPAAGATVSGTVKITVSASDNVAVTTLKYYLDESLFAISSPPTSSCRGTRSPRATDRTHWL